MVKCGNSRKSAHSPLWQTCKVLHPWALFRETTVMNRFLILSLLLHDRHFFTSCSLEVMVLVDNNISELPMMLRRLTKLHTLWWVHFCVSMLAVREHVRSSRNIKQCSFQVKKYIGVWLCTQSDKKVWIENYLPSLPSRQSKNLEKAPLGLKISWKYSELAMSAEKLAENVCSNLYYALQQ